MISIGTDLHTESISNVYEPEHFHSFKASSKLYIELVA